MATASQAIARIAEATEMLPATVVRGGRALREANVDLWPAGTQGRGQEGHPEARHLMSLLIAIAAADPITEAPQTVSRYANLLATEMHVSEAHEATTSRTKERHEQASLAPLLAQYGSTFGEHLIGLLETIENPENQNLRNMFRSAGLTVKLTTDHIPEASIILPLKTEKSTDRTETIVYLPAQNALPLKAISRSPAAMCREVTIPFALLEVLADLLSETLAHNAKKAPRKGKGAGTKNATPGRVASNQDQNFVPTLRSRRRKVVGQVVLVNSHRRPGATIETYPDV